MSDLKPVCSIKMWILTEKSHFCSPLGFEASVHKVGKTQWPVMSTLLHKKSDLKPVCSIKMWILTEKSHFCALSAMFLRLVCILKLEGLLQGYVKCSFKMWILTEKSHFCALSVISLRLVCILKLEGLLQGYVKWKNTMTGNVNLMTQYVGSETSLLD